MIPEYLLLLNGVIDCPDIPLNVSRSFLQNDRQVQKISKHITKKVADDPGLLACKAKANPDDNVGNDNGDNLQKLTEIKDNSKMFVHGAPDSFIQSLTALLGVDAKKADTMEKSQSNLLYAIDTNRKSVSGVDEDEEGSDMIVFQNMLFNQYKMLNVLNEVLDKLINETGV